MSSAIMPLAPEQQLSDDRIVAPPALKPPAPASVFAHRDLLDGPFWQNIPAYRSVTEAEFLDHSWQARNSITNIPKLLATVEGLISDDFVHDAEAKLRVNNGRWQKAFECIASRPELEDIVVSGGDVYQFAAAGTPAPLGRPVAAPADGRRGAGGRGRQGGGRGTLATTALATSPRLAAPPHGPGVDVWMADVRPARVPGAPPGARQWLMDDAELSTLARLRVADDQPGYVLSQLLLRLALSRAAGARVPPERWRFEKSPGGRPSVAPARGMPRLEFSVSRSSGLAAVAVTVTAAAESASTRSAATDHCARFRLTWRCRRPSSRICHGNPPPQRPGNFLTLWTLKEAYGKLRGCAVCLPLERLEFATSVAGRARLVRTEQGLRPPSGLHLESRRVDTAAGAYRTSLAVQCPPGARPRVVFNLLNTLWPDPGDAPRFPADQGLAEHGPEREAR